MPLYIYYSKYSDQHTRTYHIFMMNNNDFTHIFIMNTHIMNHIFITKGVCF